MAGKYQTLQTHEGQNAVVNRLIFTQVSIKYYTLFAEQTVHLFNV